MVTHDAEMADYARRIVTVRDGLIASDVRTDGRRSEKEVA
jgi:ABC-type lipoprotein export system ATPase subunit